MRLTAGSQDQLPPPNEACIVFTTYAMVTMTADSSVRRAVRERFPSGFIGFFVLCDPYHISTSAHHHDLIASPTHHLITSLTRHLIISSHWSTVHQSAANAMKLEALRSRSWGLMLLDETHQLVAKTYKQVLEFAPAHCHLGLTATVGRHCCLYCCRDVVRTWCRLVTSAYCASCLRYGLWVVGEWATEGTACA